MSKTSTQQFLEIDQIKKDVIVLKNKSLRAVLMVSSLNFALKSEEEQKATIYQYQNFLNSLDFSLQIIIQSRRVNLTGYLEKIKEMEVKQKNELLKFQTMEYQNFIKDLISGGTILSKNFFVVIPFTLLEIPEIKVKKQKTDSLIMTEEKFQRAKSQLWQRTEFITMGLRSCGLQCTPLNTSELIELFWSLYHPEQAEQGYYPSIPPELTK